MIKWNPAEKYFQTSDSGYRITKSFVGGGDPVYMAWVSMVDGRSAGWDMLPGGPYDSLSDAHEVCQAHADKLTNTPSNA